VAKLDERLRNEVLKRLEQVRAGKRDLYF
jgi:hypothetical protein